MQTQDKISPMKSKRSFLGSRIFKKNASRAGFIIVVIFVIFAIAGKFANPLAVTGVPNSAPSLSHLLGTDYLGRDVLTEVIGGTFSSLSVGVAGAAGAVLIGLLAGVVSGYYTKSEPFLLGTADIILTLPALPLLIVIGSLYPPTTLLLSILLILILWPVVARAIRSQVLSVKKMPFVDAAQTSGMGSKRIVFQILIPEVASIAIAYFVLLIATSILLVAALQFIGAGTNPLSISWGSMLYWAQQFALPYGDWWWILAPGLSITVVATGFALIGFSVEEISNPRLQV